MPVTVTLTPSGGSTQNWQVPPGYGTIDIYVEGQGGQGGDSDPVQETAGGGGGQGGVAICIGMAVQEGDAFSAYFYAPANYVQLVRSGGTLLANGGGAANGPFGGVAGDGSYGSWPGGYCSAHPGAAGQNALDNGSGGNGGGSPGNRGTLTQAPGPGWPGNGGGGGRAFNGPGTPGAGAGGRITIVMYELQNQ